MEIKLKEPNAGEVTFHQVSPNAKLLVYTDERNGDICIIEEKDVLLISNNPNQLIPLLEEHRLEANWDDDDGDDEYFPVHIIYKDQEGVVQVDIATETCIFEAPPKEVAL